MSLYFINGFLLCTVHFSLTQPHLLNFCSLGFWGHKEICLHQGHISLVRLPLDQWLCPWTGNIAPTHDWDGLELRHQVVSVSSTETEVFWTVSRITEKHVPLWVPVWAGLPLNYSWERLELIYWGITALSPQTKGVIWESSVGQNLVSLSWGLRQACLPARPQLDRVATRTQLWEAETELQRLISVHAVRSMLGLTHSHRVSLMSEIPRSSLWRQDHWLQLKRAELRCKESSRLVVG
jgi:hypothetical protein